MTARKLSKISCGWPRSGPGREQRTVCRLTVAACVLSAVCMLVVTPVAQEMPDAKQMSGMPLPVSDVAVGTVVVRVIKGSLANALAGQAVELHGPPTVLTVQTNEMGRAEFSRLIPGTRVKAVATVAGERLESQEFTVPSSGGIRLLLVATDPEAETRAAEDRKLALGPAQAGAVVLGDQSRFVFELGDDGLSVFNILQVVNTARVPVQPPQAIVFELPDGAERAAILDGSSPQGSLAGRRVTVAGPFAPGATLVQFAYSLQYSGARLVVRQTIPVPLTQLSVLAQKIGDMHLGSPQMAEHRDMTAEGQTYIVGRGPAVKAGEAITFEFTGLPHEAVWPRNVALALAALILGAGAWMAMRTRRVGSDGNSRRRKLEERRDRLFADLARLEGQNRAGGMDPQHYAWRRRDLVDALERVYIELDEEAAA